MLTANQITTIAATLRDAARTQTPMRAPTITHPGLTIADAYAIQHAWLDLRRAEGRTIKGHKIGLTSKAMQNSVGIDEPDYGVLLDDMFIASGTTIPAGKFLAPRVEIELAFRLKHRLAGPNCTLLDALAATDYVFPAIEILESRLHMVDPETRGTRKVEDSIADNAAVGAMVMGGRPMSPSEVDMQWVAGLCLRNGVIEETGVAAGVLGHPANGIAWLANKLAAHDIALEAGEILLSGSFIRPVAVRPGDTIHADYGTYGSVSCHFAAK
jgi:2-oxo-hept-3-ene-1,7-dioate hydratase